MDGFVIAAVSVGALSTLALIGALASRQERLAAPGHLERAQAAFESGELAAMPPLLQAALHQPLDDRFRPQDAEHALQTVALIEALMHTRGVDASATLEPLRDALTEASRHGGLVPRRLTNPALALLEDGPQPPLPVPAAAATPAPAAPSPAEPPHPESEPTAPESEPAAPEDEPAAPGNDTA